MAAQPLILASLQSWQSAAAAHRSVPALEGRLASIAGRQRRQRADGSHTCKSERQGLRAQCGRHDNEAVLQGVCRLSCRRLTGLDV